MERVRALIKILKGIGIKGAKSIESKDPQYIALYRMSKRVEAGPFVKYVVANSLISYQLSGKAEDYWNEFEEKLSITGNIYRDMKNFLEISAFNKRLTNVKLKRLKKAQKILEEITPSMRFKDVWKKLYVFGKYRKTVVFSIKMFGYAKRIIKKKFTPFPMEIPIPLDSRIKKITKMLTNKEPLKFWRAIALKTGIPPLHIDSILWNAMGKNKAKELTEVRKWLSYIYKTKVVMI